jgi:hypothetical protein
MVHERVGAELAELLRDEVPLAVAVDGVNLGVVAVPLDGLLVGVNGDEKVGVLGDGISHRVSADREAVDSVRSMVWMDDSTATTWKIAGACTARVAGVDASCSASARRQSLGLPILGHDKNTNTLTPKSELGTHLCGIQMHVGQLE